MKNKGIIRYIFGVLGCLLLIVVIYVAYVFLSYTRIEDDLVLDVEQRAKNEQVILNKEYNITTFNVGYGSYPPDYTFFMDGGNDSRAYSEESVVEMINGIISDLKKTNFDFAMLQEVDEKATRSHHVNEFKQIMDSFPTYTAITAINYDSAYLMYPFTEPIGQSKSGLLTLSDVKVTSSKRYSLPIETDFNKFFDLDRAYSISRVKVANGKELVLYNVHLSAYMKDQEIQKEQIKKLFDDLKKESDLGNYVICGGDFNHDLLNTSSTVFKNKDDGNDYSWLKPFPKELLDKNLRVLTPVKEIKPSVRNLDKPYKEGESFVALIDGFIISDNVKVVDYSISDLKFEHSDHNPVTLSFLLK